MPTKLNTEQFVEKATLIHGDTYSYELVDYIKTNTKVQITCKAHGVFYQRPNDHLSGYGCSLCAIHNRSKAHTSNTTHFISKAISIHGLTYDYSNVEYVNTRTDVEIVCPVHGSFNQIPMIHLAGSGCTQCATTRVASNRTKSQSTYINEASIKHGNKYNYSLLNYVSAVTKIKIICPIHGVFEQKASEHLYYGCRHCADNANGISRTKSLESFVHEAREVHNNKYDYSQVVYLKSNVLVTILCAEHGAFTQTPNSHLGGSGCLTCANENSAQLKLKPLSQFIVESNNVHQHKYDYSRVQYDGTYSKVLIICPSHGTFNQLPKHHLRGAGCPTCANSMFSHKSISWIKYVSSDNNDVILHALNGGEFRIPGTRMKVDGYCKETNTVYEFHGDYWHGNPDVYDPTTPNDVIGKTMGELYNNTIIRESKIRDMGYNLVVMWERQWDNIQ